MPITRKVLIVIAYKRKSERVIPVLASVAHLLEHHPVHLRVSGSIASQDIHPSCGFNPGSEHICRGN